MKRLTGILIVLLLVVSAIAGGALTYIFTEPKPSIGMLGSNAFLVTMNDTGANRAFNVTYQNYQGDVMFLSVFITGEDVIVALLINSTVAGIDPNGTWSGFVEIPGNGVNSTVTTVQLQGFVPPRFHYQIYDKVLNDVGLSPDVSIGQWFESIPPTGFGAIINVITETAKKPQPEKKGT